MGDIYEEKKKKVLFRLLIFLFFAIIMIRQQIIIFRINKDIKTYNEMLNKLKAQNIELKEELKISERIDYIERLARQKLRLIKPGRYCLLIRIKRITKLTCIIYFYII
ncbi:septum formation initiator family protein [Caloramator sp. mosi_1]|uniref:septum formation initiator family protein n=1 Tax=Caloramator sp. mosi_1 TaxID=3023090 RepID=UPI00235E4636|nr:septum formation initiator family protein [Caloramator sp. mosi_1]WDC85474.1 septum formation initiator family protein [Caloramator sp. mosi_1]